MAWTIHDFLGMFRRGLPDCKTRLYIPEKTVPLNLICNLPIKYYNKMCVRTA